MADTYRLTPVDQCVVNAAALILHTWSSTDREVLRLVDNILPSASTSHPTFGPVAEAVIDLQQLHSRRDLDPAAFGERRRHCHDRLRRVISDFFTWRLEQALRRVHGSENGEAA